MKSCSGRSPLAPWGQIGTRECSRGLTRVVLNQKTPRVDDQPVDGGAPAASSAGSLGGNGPGLNQRRIESVIPLGEGTHTIYAWVRINAAVPWAQDRLGNFCLEAKGSEEDH